MRALQSLNLLLRRVSHAAAAGPTIIFVVMMATVPYATAQSYTVLHNFTGGADGSTPYGGLNMDSAGNLYGTTCGIYCLGAGSNWGTVFRLSQRGLGWVLTTLYTFQGGPDGSSPTGRVVFGRDGNLYGTTIYGGHNGCGGSGCGTVFKLTPPSANVPPNATAGWIKTTLYGFLAGNDGKEPMYGDVVFDQAGNLYGTTAGGGPQGAGTVYKLTPSGGGWTESVIYAFTGGGDGAEPLGTLYIADNGGVAGSAFTGGRGSCLAGEPCGTIFELTPSASAWTENTLYTFQGGSDGGNPIGGPLGCVDTSCIITASQGGMAGGGRVFILNNGLFDHEFAGSGNTPGPWASLTGSETGLYGTTYEDGAYQMGSVFMLSGCAGWGYTDLHDFSGTDGSYPVSSLVYQSGSGGGVLYGTTSQGGAYGYGVVFALTLPSGREDVSKCANRRQGAK